MSDFDPDNNRKRSDLKRGSTQSAPRFESEAELRRRHRWAVIRGRLALVCLGLALGFAARWVGQVVTKSTVEPHFKPMPAEVKVADEQAESKSTDASIDESKAGIPDSPETSDKKSQD